MGEGQAQQLIATVRPLCLFWEGNAHDKARKACGRLVKHAFVRIVPLDDGVEPDHLSGAELSDLLPFLLLLAEDTVRMPRPERFEHRAEYYATLFHELGHSTGHVDRLGRKGIVEQHTFGTDPYGQEELVAEMTASFLCGNRGISHVTLENSAASFGFVGLRLHYARLRFDGKDKAQRRRQRSLE